MTRQDIIVGEKTQALYDKYHAGLLKGYDLLTVANEYLAVEEFMSAQIWLNVLSIITQEEAWDNNKKTRLEWLNT